MTNEVKVLPYKVEAGKVFEVEITKGAETIRVPLSIGIPFDEEVLSLFGHVNWSELRKDTKSFRAEHKENILKNIRKREKIVLEYIWNHGNIEFSFERLKNELNISKAYITKIIQVLQLSSLLSERRTKRVKTVRLTAFGSEVCSELFPQKPFDIGKKVLVDAIK